MATPIIKVKSSPKVLVKVLQKHTVIPNDYNNLKNIPTFDGKEWKGSLTAEELSLLTSDLSKYEQATIETGDNDKIVMLSAKGKRFVIALSDLLEYVKSYDMGEQIIVEDSGDIQATLTPNIYYLFTGEITSLSIFFGEAKAGRYNEFKGQFRTGSNVPVVSFPASVKWVGEEFPTLEADRTYQFSVLNDIGVIVGV